MTKLHVPRATLLLQPGCEFDHPPDAPELLHPDSPAIEAMTDFREVWPISVSPEMNIDDALEHMKRAGVRMLLVVDEDRRIIGIVTAEEFMGELPIKLVEGERSGRDAVTVSMVMTPQDKVRVLDMISVKDAQVQHIGETLRELESRHVLVVDSDPDTGAQRVRGLFSHSRIQKLLGGNPVQDVPAAHSLAEIVHGSG
ncbi:MAG: CBS domain-containing protein [Pseudomonadota bacterium]|nr:CBS domain-containing protein [Pseudomonadota bacterium]